MMIRELKQNYYAKHKLTLQSIRFPNYHSLFFVLDMQHRVKGLIDNVILK
jgi:hypothetical protein